MCALTRALANHELRDQQRQTEDNDAEQIDDKKRTTAVLTGNVREFPDVS